MQQHFQEKQLQGTVDFLLHSTVPYVQKFKMIETFFL
jgi:hypothetical protein